MKFRTTTVCLLAALLCSCIVGLEKQRAETIMTDYYSKLQRGAFVELLPLFSGAFLQATPKEKYLRLMTGLRARMGTYKTSSLSNWNYRTTTGTGAGRYVTLTYKVTYERGEATETFLLFEARGSSKLLIQSYDIKSDALIENNDVAPPEPERSEGSA